MSAPAQLCGCGQPSLYRATGECQRCYDARKSAPRRRRLAEIYATPCTYEAAHSRVRSARGAAAGWLCSGCGEPAEQWAYVGDSPREIRGQRRWTRDGRRHTSTLAWSPNPADYVALCRPCHGRGTRRDYGAGYRHDESAREAYRARQRDYHRRRHAQLTADPAAREAYNARKRLEAQRRREKSRSTHRAGPNHPQSEGDL